MRVGPSKEYGDTSTITLRFRTLGMTLSRGKLPQAGRNTSLPSHSPFFSDIMLVLSFIIDPSARSSSLFFSSQNHFYQADNTLSLLSARHHLQRRLINDHDPSTPFERSRLSPSNLIHFASRSPCSRLVDPRHILEFLRCAIIFIWHVSIRNRFYRFMACVLYRR